MSDVPNMTIIMRDDWIEIDIVHYYSGVMFQYTFFPDGTAKVSVECRSAESVDVYAALSNIADISTDNVQAFKDRP